MADLRHKRDANARRFTRPVLIAAPLALVATATAITVGLALEGSSSAPSAEPTASAELSVAARELDEARVERAEAVSRSDQRSAQTVEKAPNMTDRKVTRAAIRKAVAAKTTLYTTDDLNLWTSPGKKADQEGEVDAGKKVVVTGRRLWGRDEIVVQGRSRWVTVGYLSQDKPLGVGAGLSMEPCPDGSVESGLTDNAVFVYRSVCHAFPVITTYGGFDNHGEHASGRALDIMTSDYTVGQAIADFLRAHAAELKLYDVIYRQRIFTQERAGEGWRAMSDRGSATANHLDHVHVSTY